TTPAPRAKSRSDCSSSRISGGSIEPYALHCGIKHFDEARLGAEVIEIRVVRRQSNDVRAGTRHYRSKHLDRRLRIAEDPIEAPGKIVSHLEVVGVDQEAALDPIARPVPVPKGSQGHCAERE